LRKALVAADSTNGDYRHLLSLAYQNDGDYQAWNKNTNAALDSFQKKLTIDEQSVAADPANAQARDDLAYASARFEDMLVDSGLATQAPRSLSTRLGPV